MRAPHPERHKSDRAAWLRAAVLGADDGIVSTASLMLGVAATSAATSTIAVAGLAGLVAGAASMATGEYVSVSSQRDAEAADVARERRELVTQPRKELEELEAIWRERGLDPALARQVAERLHTVDPLGSHLRDELGLTEATRARPLQAAAVSAVSFAAGAGLPLLALAAAPAAHRSLVIAGLALVLLGVLGALGGRLGGASPRRAAWRVLVGGGLAMLATTLVGRLVGVAVG
jgi:VIT1/CCC1 family predicted Fe2+/Mn2+ transporter